MLKLGQGVDILLDTITNDRRHPDYARVCELAKDYKTYVTLEGIREKLKRFNQRETETLFNQRVELTKDGLTTGDIAGSCQKPMYKIGRAPAVKALTWKTPEETTKNAKEVEAVANSFYGEKSVNEYLTEAMVDFDGTDPNAWLVVEFTTTDGTGIKDPNNPDNKLIVYPFEVSSEDAINFQFKNQIPQFLVVETAITISTQKGTRDGCKYTIYLPINSVTATEIDKSMVQEWKNANKHTEITSLNENTIFAPKTLYFYQTKQNKKDKYYVVQVYEHKIPFVPAKRYGTKLDLVTNKRTCVSMMHAARPYFEQAIKTVSEFILTNCLHVFPQKIQYSDPCPGYQEDAGNGNHNTIGCTAGLTPTGKICKACNGSGFKYHQSSQDMLQIRMPKNLDDMVSLENVIVYKFPPMELLTFLKTLGLYELRYLALKAVYNSEVFNKDDIQTAFEKAVDLDSVYDALKPFAGNYSSMWRMIHKCIIALKGLSDGSEVVHAFPNDFKMKPYTLLLEDLQKATTNGAPSHIRKAIIKDITDKLYIDKPDEILKVNTKEKYFPFTGKTETEINYILSNDLCSEYNKILYSNFELIFLDLEYDAANQKVPVDFYKIAEVEQRKLITEKVKEYITTLTEADAANTASAFNKAAGDTLLNDVVTTGPDGNPLDLTKFNPDGTPKNQPAA